MSSRYLVDPELRPLLDSLPPFNITQEVLAIVRTSQMPLVDPGDFRDATELSQQTVPGIDGGPGIGVAIYRPKPVGALPLPCILHIHGGGYVAGTLLGQEKAHRALAATLRCVLVSVDYRLAPEAPFPAPIQDCYGALAWAFTQAQTLGIDTTRIGVMGESAGGGLAAALALMARDRGQYTLAFQHLIYPMLDDRTVSRTDPHPYAGEFVWTAASNRFGWTSLLGTEPGSPHVSPYAAAARATDLARLPPTFIGTGALDLFVEEDMEYARRLMRAGVPVELHVYPGAYHGFDILTDASVAKDARRDSMQALARALKRLPAP